EWAKPRGRKSHRRHCGLGDRGAAVLWPDQAITGHVTRAGPIALRKKTWRESSNPHKRAPASGEGKETLACRWASLNVPTPGHTVPRWRRIARQGPRLNPIEALRRAALEWSHVG